MKNKKIDDVLKNTAVGYEKIATDFSGTRKYVWSDLRVFLSYIKDGDRVLDVGCGNGRIIDLLGTKKIEYFGVDQSASLIALATNRYPEHHFKVMDALALAVPDQSFDVVLSVAVLNHMPTRELQLQYLQNVATALKPGGYLLMTNWNLWNIMNKKGLAAFQREKDELSDDDFLRKYQVSKVDLAERDVITLWAGKGLLYYYAFEVDELADLLRSADLIVEQNYYSKSGSLTEQSYGDNIVTIARRL